MSDFEDSTDSELSDGEIELQKAFADGRLKPGINYVEDAPKQFLNKVNELKEKLDSIQQDLPWIEKLDSLTDPAPMAPELAAKVQSEEEKRENMMKNNKKLQQFAIENDPVVNDFKRELIFYRQAQATVLQCVPKLKQLNIPIIRPSDYFAEMAKSDTQMQRIRETLMKKQAGQQRMERVKQIRQQRKEGKAIQIQTKLQRDQEKREMLNQVKKVRKGVSKDMSFLDKKAGPSKKSIEKRKMKDQKYGFGGKKSGKKMNTKESSADMRDFDDKSGNYKNRKGGKNGKFIGKNKGMRGKKVPNQRPGKSKRQQKKSKGRK